MATQIYLGYPPENIKKWIKEEAERKYQEMLKTPLTFTAEEPNATMYFNKDEYADYDNQVVFSYDKQNWSNYEYGTEITLANVGDKVYFRAADDIENESFNGYQFDINNGKIAASGNLNTLLIADGQIFALTGKDSCYAAMFCQCTSLTQAPELPAAGLAYSCYSVMFAGCTSLIKAPSILPATALYPECYIQMFSDCTSLKQAPKLPATELANSCYYSMFYGCSSLTSAPELPATELAYQCYCEMFSACTSLTQAPTLPATTFLDDECYYSMFYGCSSLTQASFPNLEKETVATEVVEYAGAFIEAASDIETTCKDGILIINSSEA